jgi:glycogen debranching enzyme
MNDSEEGRKRLRGKGTICTNYRVEIYFHLPPSQHDTSFHFHTQPPHPEKKSQRAGRVFLTHTVDLHAEGMHSDPKSRENCNKRNEGNRVNVSFHSVSNVFLSSRPERVGESNIDDEETHSLKCTQSERQNSERELKNGRH